MFVIFLRLKIKSQKLIENKLKNQFWYKKNFKRDESEKYLKGKPFGAFVIRQSESVKNSYVLSVKVPIYINKSMISHYLILKGNDNKYVLEGIDRKFTSLTHLVNYFSFLRDALPVMLNIEYEYNNIVEFVYI